MERVLEPEIMDGREAAEAYAQADFSDSNQTFVDDVVRRCEAHLASVVDLGCGPGDVAVRLARAVPAVRIVAVDGSLAMLNIAREAVHAAQLTARVELHPGRLPGLALREHSFDAVLCKDMLHHLPDPQALWSEARRLGRPGALVYVMDLMRPGSPLEAREIVERVSGREHPLLKEDFYNSLCAAFTVEEVRAQLKTAGLDLSVERASERHMTVKGALA
ncbi:MAG: class I SAM-dependent methyltransferase [Steroidobacteraceae bacterium]